jgi:cell division protein FtsB
VTDEQLPAPPRKRRRVRNILAVAAAVVVVGAVTGIAIAAADARAANARAANAVRAAQAAAKSDYAARNAALNREAAALQRQSQAIAAETGELRANTIRADGMYLVGHDVKPGTWHTVGDGSASGGHCAYAVIGSANTAQRNIYFDGPWTVDLSGAHAFAISGPCTWVRVPP